MSEQDLLDRAGEIVASALRAGAEAAEVYMSRTRRTEVRIRAGRIERTLSSDGSGSGLRVDRGGRQGFASTTDLSDDGLRRLVEAATATAAVAPEDPDAAIPADVGAQGGQAAGRPAIDDPSVERLGFPDMVALARRAEEAALAVDPSVRPGEGSAFSRARTSVAIVSSHGTCRSWSGTHCSLACSPVAARGGEQQRQHWFETRRFLSDLPSPEEVGSTAARRALRMLGARPIPSGKIHVVFDPLEGSAFWGSLSSAFLGDSVRRKVSFLAGELGRRVAHGSVTLADDPTMARAAGSRPCDGEGRPTSSRALISEGTLEAFLYDTRTGRRAGAASTASAVRSYGSPPSPGAHAPVLRPGTSTPGEILASAGRGLYVMQLMGFGTNLVTGDYSRGASGWWFENGEYAHAVQKVTLSGNLRQMLEGIRLVGNDLVTRSAAASPTFLMEGLVASGGEA